MVTNLQRKLIKLILEHIGKTGDRTSLGEMLLKAGYSKSVAKNPFLIFNSPAIKKELNPLIIKLIRHRDKILKRMEQTLSKAKYRDAVDGLDKVTKNVELLSGRATERHAVLDEEKKAKIDEMMEDFTDED